ncbi:Alpha/Beta hydrolase fold [Phytophthora cactorum]|nr:Alpha/Beta hydrolase fold [Phytophthora cactorum]
MTIIEKEVAAGIPLSRIVLGGSARRGLVALLGLSDQDGVGGIISMSGYLPRYASFQCAPETTDVPLLMCHGEQDPVVRFDYGKMSKEKLETAFHSYPDMEHGACMEELDDVTKWLQRVIPETQK